MSVCSEIGTRPGGSAPIRVLQDDNVSDGGESINSHDGADHAFLGHLAFCLHKAWLARLFADPQIKAEFRCHVAESIYRCIKCMPRKEFQPIYDLAICILRGYRRARKLENRKCPKSAKAIEIIVAQNIQILKAQKHIRIILNVHIYPHLKVRSRRLLRSLLGDLNN